MIKLIVISIFLFITSLLILSFNIRSQKFILDKPFYGEHDHNGARFGNIARNYLYYGFIPLKFAQVESSGETPFEDLIYYTHYPPLLPVLISLSYKLFGVSEVTTRIVPTLFSAGSIVLIFLIGKKLGSIKVGIFASLFSLVTPMFQYFGKNPVHEPGVLFFVLSSFYFYISYFFDKKRISKYLFIVFLILAGLTAWAGYFLLPALIIVHIFRQEWKFVKELLPLVIVYILLFLLHALQVKTVTGYFSGGDIFQALLSRTGIDSAQPEGFNLIGYILRVRLWFFTLFTGTLTTISLIWLISKFKLLKSNEGFILVLGIFATIYILVFPSAVFIHNYLIFYFLPFIALSIALLISKYAQSKYLFIATVAIVLLISIIERQEFVVALHESKGDQFSWEIGTSLNKMTQKDDVILLTPASLEGTSDKFIRFYSDRRVIFSDNRNLEHTVLVIVDKEQRKFEISYVK